MRTSIDPLMTRSRPMYKIEVDEASRSSGRFNLDRIDRIAQEQKNEDLDSWTSPQPVPTLRDLDSDWIRPLRVDVALLGLTPSSTGGSQAQGIAVEAAIKDSRESCTRD